MQKPWRVFNWLLFAGWLITMSSGVKPLGLLAPGVQHPQSAPLPKEELLPAVKKSSHSRQKHDAECPPDKIITDEMAHDELMPIYYEPAELQACLNKTNILKYYSLMSQYAFTEPQLEVLKKKMDESFPYGYPDSIVRSFRDSVNDSTPEDIKKWNITTLETLDTLLKAPPATNLVAPIVQQYMGEFDANATKYITPKYLCDLSEKQLNKFSVNTIKTADPPLDPFNCSHATKIPLYPKAKRAYSDRHNEFPWYYDHIRPYLGGAPGEDLIALGKNNVNMDIPTFKSLRNDALMELSVKNVEDLLGNNLKDLKDHQNENPIKSWIRRQKQSDLDQLNLGIRGGLPEGYIVLPSDPGRKRRAIPSIH